MKRKPYPSDLSDAEWALIEPHIPPAKPGGRPRGVDMREILNGILYVTREGIRWHSMPHDLPVGVTCYWYHRKFQAEGFYETLNDLLRRDLRQHAGRDPEPSRVIIDSQSVKTMSKGGKFSGYDAGKKVNGRKRHILTDTMGLLIAVIVHSANIQDRDGARALLTYIQEWLPRVTQVVGDGGYAGKKLIGWVAKTCGWQLEIIKRSDEMVGFEVLPVRWVVERTFGWLGHYRRLRTDYEGLTEVSEAFVYVAMIRLMLRRLTR